MKIYIAARFSRRAEANQLAQHLKTHGHEITARWVKPDCTNVPATASSDQAPDDQRQRFALEDLDDVMACDWCISLMENPRNDSRGGRHVEFGIAIGLGKFLTIIGPRETVFHHLPSVTHFANMSDFLQAIGGEVTK